jgi:hypothetical protein
VPDPFEITFKVTLHFDCDSVFQQIPPLGEEFRRKGAQTLFGILAVRRASEVHLGVGETVAAGPAFSGRIILEKFNHSAAFGTLCLEYGAFTPVLGILSRTSHGRHLLVLSVFTGWIAGFSPCFYSQARWT